MLAIPAIPLLPTLAPPLQKLLSATVGLGGFTVSYTMAYKESGAILILEAATLPEREARSKQKKKLRSQVIHWVLPAPTVYIRGPIIRGPIKGYIYIPVL